MIISCLFEWHAAGIYVKSNLQIIFTTMILSAPVFQPQTEIFKKAKYKVAVEVQRIFRPQKHGMDVVAFEILKRLPSIEDSFDYHVMVKDDADQCLSDMPHRIIHTLKKAPYFIWEQFLLPKACIRAKADFLHCTANTAPLHTSMPLVLTLHDVIFLERSNLWSKASWYQRLGNMYRSAIVSGIAKKAARIITVSHCQKQLIAEKLGISEEKIRVVYNGVDDRFFKSLNDKAIASVLRKHQLKAGYILFLANTDSRKNTAGVLSAYAELLRICPSAPRLLIKGLNRKQLVKLLWKEHLEAMFYDIDLIGYIDADELPAIYQAASMLWFPSFSEGFGLPIIEAMASGTPVITSNISCMPEIAGEAALLVNPHQPKEIASAASLLLNDAPLAADLAAAGRKRASEFTWDRAAEQTVAVYHEVENIKSNKK